MVSEKFCPVCHHLNKDTAFICGTCSSELGGKSTELMLVTEYDNPTADASAVIDTTMIPEDGVAIYIAGAPKPYYLSIDKELILGRQVDVMVEALLDLTALSAYNLGVSRQHAIIQRVGSGFEVLDLASRNGTWLNAKRLTPNQPYRFASGSQLRLGRMQLSVMYHLADNIARKK